MSEPLRTWLPHRRLLHGVGATAMPSIVFVGIGVAFGRYGVNIVGDSALASLEPVTATALAVLGAFVGLEIGRPHETRWPVVMAAATVELLATISVVAGGLLALIASWHLPVRLDTGVFVLLMAACVAATAGIRVADDSGIEVRRAAAIADMDDVPLSLLGAMLLALLAGGHIGVRVAATVVVAVIVGAATALLLRGEHREWERPVVIGGGLLLAGGAATYAGTSPLLGGCVMAIVWTRASAAVRGAAEEQLRRFQHPLVALLLAIAGASFTWTRQLPWIAAALVLLRVTGKLTGGALAARLVRAQPSVVATTLLPPGVLGIALALNAEQILPGADPIIVAGSVLVLVISEVVSLLLLLGEPIA